MRESSASLARNQPNSNEVLSTNARLLPVTMAGLIQYGNMGRR